LPEENAMPIELLMLALSVALLFVLIVIQATAGVKAQGMDVMAGHRDDMKPPSAWQARTKRCVDNHREGLMLFAPLVLIAAHLNISNDLTVWGAALLLFARGACRDLPDRTAQGAAAGLGHRHHRHGPGVCGGDHGDASLGRTVPRQFACETKR
jgi:uncharacterized MAPEG superfamily protein